MSSNKCQTHPLNAQSLYCKDCDLKICSECISLHKKHEVYPLTYLNPKSISKSAMTILQRIENFREIAMPIIKLLKKEYDAIDNYILECKASLVKVEGTLEEIKKKMKKESETEQVLSEKESLQKVLMLEDLNASLGDQLTRSFNSIQELIDSNQYTLKTHIAALNKDIIKAQQPLLYSTADQVHYFEPGTPNLYLYNIAGKKVTKVKCSQNVASGYIASIEVAKIIYVCGGKEGDKYTNKLFTYCAGITELQEKEPMEVPKDSHSLCCTKGKLILSIGGFNNEYLNTCECYNIEKGKWEMYPKLSEPKKDLACTSAKDKFIFSFGGNKDNDNLATIEKLSLDNLTIGWVKVAISDQNGWTKRSGLEAVTIQDDLIILFGGVSGTETFEFCPSKVELTKCKVSLVKPDRFYSTGRYVINDQKVYALSVNLNLHIYSYLSEAKWELIKIQ